MHNGPKTIDGHVNSHVTRSVTVCEFSSDIFAQTAEGRGYSCPGSIGS